MHRNISPSVLLGLVISVAIAAPVAAGDCRHAGGKTPWYDQPPHRGAGTGIYYSQYPTHVPGYPTKLQGLVVPIYGDPAQLHVVPDDHRHAPKKRRR